jgi:hypothetical protein
MFGFLAWKASISDLEVSTDTWVLSTSRESVTSSPEAPEAAALPDGEAPPSFDELPQAASRPPNSTAQDKDAIIFLVFRTWPFPLIVPLVVHAVEKARARVPFEFIMNVSGIKRQCLISLFDVRFFWMEGIGSQVFPI